MRNNKIFLKLFGLTAGVVMILLLIQFVVQYFWLEEFYVYNKEKSVSSELITAKEKIEKEEITEENVEKFLNQYSIENNIYIGISDRKGMPQYGLTGEDNLSYIQIEDDNKGIYIIYMDAFFNNNELTEALKKNKMIQVQGLLQDIEQKKVYPENITIDNREFSTLNRASADSTILIEKIEKEDIIDTKDTVVIDISEQPLAKIEWVEVQDIQLNGAITDINLTSKENYGTEYRRQQLLQEIFLFLGKEKNINTFFKDNKLIKYMKVDPFTGIKNIIFVQPLFIESKEPMLMFAVSSLQPIEETTEIMKTYFFFVLLVAMLLAIIAAYLYSKRITAPLLHLNGVTENMARLDFSQKCSIKTNDEMGDLAENINIMSEKLKNTLEEVKKSNEKLRKDLIFKEKIEQFRKRFIADASHELKTPLTVIKGICEGVEDGIYDYKDKEHFKNILNEINDMSHLVYDLLEISRLESGEVPFQKDVFQLCDIVLKVHGKLKPLLEAKNLIADLKFTEDFVIGDEEKIERVIRNLYYNAIQYTPQNGNIKLYMNRSKDNCFFNIENKPAKISEGELEKIWEPFYRLEKSRNKALGGSGLGLHMVKEVLDKHDSQYGIENTEVGVKAYFSLQIITNGLEI